MNDGFKLQLAIEHKCERSQVVRRGLIKAKYIGFGLVLAMGLCTPQIWAGEDCGYVTNGNFEVASADDATIPAGWFLFFSKNKTMALSQVAPRAGSNCLKMSAQDVKGANMGIGQTISVDDGKTYTFTVYVMSNPETPLTRGVYGMIGIEWKDSTGKEIYRTASPEWDPSLSRMRWELRRVSDKAPRGAKTATMTISLYDGDNGGLGSCFVDDAEVEMK